MPLLTLPNELIFQIARYLLRCPTCHCDHVLRHLSAISRSNNFLHTFLAEYLLVNSSPVHMLLWAIANSRHNTVTIALARGADPNTPLRPNPYIHPIGPRRRNTIVDVAIRMRVHSANAESHALKLGTLALLFAAGGTCTTNSLFMSTRYGDLDLLTLCLGHLEPRDRLGQSGPEDLLAIAASCGHVEATKMMIAAGAPVNSTGADHTRGYYPPLWSCWNSSIPVLQVLLDAGADATWRCRNDISIVQNMRQRSGHLPELEEKIALLMRYGAVDEPALWQVVDHRRPARRLQNREYRGWIPGSTERPVDWVKNWALAERNGGCGCLSCPLQVTGGRYRNGEQEVRRSLVASDIVLQNIYPLT